jgi:hypothetical protein
MLFDNTAHSVSECKIQGSHSNANDDYHLLQYDAVYTGLIYMASCLRKKESSVFQKSSLQSTQTSSFSLQFYGQRVDSYCHLETGYAYSEVTVWLDSLARKTLQFIHNQAGHTITLIAIRC